VKIDVRLTPTFSGHEAASLVAEVTRSADAMNPTRRPTEIDIGETWPPYRLAEDSVLVSALRRSAEHHLGRDMALRVCGPSNIGNYLAAHDIPATCGFGVAHRNLHGIDEAIDLATIAPVYEAYRDAVAELMASSAGSSARTGAPRRF
jgi:succinyl-diaminopimelate desuccinylase